ncbi:MAG: pyrroloquinoline quinone biosynthesis protein PqqE [Alphaproteobacteria bacterium]|jgi:pyrroloquinoline quinone biosynthesis protein E|nr:pyrroloquinoline quinone biosynthesis protein PqqE [Alphaproteobacteria bacterium]MDP6238589.1 pyrroloquinoline quinone biosynthesis protein PqqE [Alphaproteobacteria bacterium]MDP7173334.1 pyrroloquinoline quinone biosynthesis protein PqqE [Alphaproteobacteria bacterium]MDP7234714.1 pyrroloquinoline quinone biosynthesis protein PqqE [Alphaproteobacteria bacterium]MDP7487793.1 pyrroloquinoline quinone biosynthesis protein PqqE [Alphaproteobacteria bacterium]|tara:strand:- start:4067 stop:5194 length:1128 start_codon:yes stop_codon:yes gene_type:complete
MSEVAGQTAVSTEATPNKVVPYAVLMELSHRCPLQCPYCTNPIDLERASGELTTEEWKRVMDEAVDMGVLHVHYSGGEPTVRKDLEELIEHAAKLGLYSNLITSGVLLNKARVQCFAELGLDHVQISFQDTTSEVGDWVAGYDGAHEKKQQVARWVREAGMPLTVNAVMHRHNLHHLEEMIQMAVDLDAERIEVAQVQYYAWAFRNRIAFLPTRKQLDKAVEIVGEARERLKGVLAFDFVVPDYYAQRPKSCMGGWGRQFINISPSGKVLPCHAAEVLPDLEFDSVHQKPLGWIWENSEAFEHFRGSAWMPEPCQSCDRKEIDWGGCRCQAYMLTGNAAVTDPTCALSPDRAVLDEPLAAVGGESPDFIYRRYGG